MSRSLTLATLALLTILTAKVQADKIITGCGHHDYPPWNWQHQRQIIGACATISQELFARLGYTLKLDYTGPWARCQKNVREGKVDVNICAVINSERQQYSLFTTQPVGYNENAIFVRRDRQFPFEQWQDLADRRVGLVRGVRIDTAFDTFIAGQPAVSQVNSYHQLFEMLRRDRIDYVPLGRFSGRAIRDSMGLTRDIVDLPTPVLTAPLHISISKLSPHRELIPWLDALLQEPGYNTWRNELLLRAQQQYAAQSSP